jgi:hypothetical protein
MAFTVDPLHDRCKGGVVIQRISALDSPDGYIDRPFVCGCVKGDRIEAAQVLIHNRGENNAIPVGLAEACLREVT